MIFGVYLIISDYLVGSHKANKNWQKRSLVLQYTFAQKTSLFLRTSTQHCKKYTSATQPKTLLTLQFFQQTYFWLVLLIAPAFNLVGGELNNFLKMARCLGLVKCFKIFYFD